MIHTIALTTQELSLVICGIRTELRKQKMYHIESLPPDAQRGLMRSVEILESLVEELEELQRTPDEHPSAGLGVCEPSGKS